MVEKTDDTVTFKGPFSKDMLNGEGEISSAYKTEKGLFKNSHLIEGTIVHHIDRSKLQSRIAEIQTQKNRTKIYFDNKLVFEFV